MLRIMLDLLSPNLRRWHCWRRGHRYSDMTRPIACLWCGHQPGR